MKYKDITIDFLYEPWFTELDGERSFFSTWIHEIDKSYSIIQDSPITEVIHFVTFIYNVGYPTTILSFEKKGTTVNDLKENYDEDGYSISENELLRSGLIKVKEKYDSIAKFGEMSFLSECQLFFQKPMSNIEEIVEDALGDVFYQKLQKKSLLFIDLPIVLFLN